MLRPGSNLAENRKILFELEVLQARLYIRDFFLSNTVKELYENVGQVLAVVKNQLSVLPPTPEDIVVNDLVDSGNLLAQSIRDLRKMTKSFYPEKDIIQKQDSLKAINYLLEIMGVHIRVKCNSTVPEHGITDEIKLLTFKLLLQMLLSLQEQHLGLQGFEVKYNNDYVDYIITCEGKPGDVQAKHTGIDALSFNTVLELIDATYNCKKHTPGISKILLKVPYK